MQNVIIQKLKNVLLFILKSTVLIFICSKLILVFLCIMLFVEAGYTHIFHVFKLNFSTFYITGITTQILQIVVFYFISKKFGIIKTFDKLPYWALLPIFIFYEFLILHWGILNDESMEGFMWQPLNYFNRFKMFSLQGCGYLYTFLTYSIIRLLNKKYPKALSNIFKRSKAKS